MSARVSLRVARGAADANREELRRQLLALVLAAVLVWYTLVVPAHAGGRGAPRPTPDDEGLDGEVRGAAGAAPAGRADAPPAEELDWPEFIYP